MNAPTNIGDAVRQSLHEAVDTALDATRADLPLIVRIADALGVAPSSIIKRAEELAQ